MDTWFAWRAPGEEMPVGILLLPEQPVISPSESLSSNFSLSVRSYQILALMPFSPQERTPSLSRATDSSLLSWWAMQFLSYTNKLDNPSMQVSRWEESFPRPSAISLIFYTCQVLITSLKIAQQGWGEYSSTSLTKDLPPSMWRYLDGCLWLMIFQTEYRSVLTTRGANPQPWQVKSFLCSMN